MYTHGLCIAAELIIVVELIFVRNSFFIKQHFENFKILVISNLGFNSVAWNHFSMEFHYRHHLLQNYFINFCLKIIKR